MIAQLVEKSAGLRDQPAIPGAQSPADNPEYASRLQSVYNKRFPAHESASEKAPKVVSVAK
jgi:hypothetical protein